MKVRVSAAGLLEDYLPAGSDGETTVEIPDAPPAATLLTVMREAGIPESASPLIALNGVVVPRGQHAARTVADGDAVHFMPNLKGGVSAAATPNRIGRKMSENRNNASGKRWLS